MNASLGALLSPLIRCCRMHRPAHAITASVDGAAAAGGDMEWRGVEEGLWVVVGAVGEVRVVCV